MKYLFLLALLLPLSPAANAEDAAPDLVRLEARLKQEQASKDAGDSERYAVFLPKFRTELEEALARVPSTPANAEAHARIRALLGDDAKVGAQTPDRIANATIAAGQEKLKSGDYAGALAAADDILKTDPANKNALFLRHASSGRTTPTSSGGQPAAGSRAEQAAGSGGVHPTVAFTNSAKRKAIVGEVPLMNSDAPEPDSGSAPLWPVAVPFGLGLIGYGVYRTQKKGEAADASIQIDAKAGLEGVAGSAFEVDRGGRTTWGANEPLAPPAERSPEQIANNRRNLKYTLIAGAVVVGGVLTAEVGPLVYAGAEGFFMNMGAASGGGLAPAFAGVGGGAAASAVNPVTVAAGAKALGVTAVVVGEAKVASDYYSHAERASVAGGSPGGDRKNGVYKDSPKHGTSSRGGQETEISGRPTNGQKALDQSTQIKPTSPRRIGVDPANNEIVILDQTSVGQFHGHVRVWAALTDQMKNALIKAGFTNSLGKILAQ